MNEHIEELFGQALDEVVSETWSKLTPEQVVKLSNKFAELLIRECATLAYDGPNGILEHFGVEE